MKRLLAVILAVLLLMSAGMVGVFAAKGNFGRSFVDADENGICDNREEATYFVDENSNGVCDNRENNVSAEPQGSEKGKGFVDADEDGVCDNFGNCPKQGKGCGRQVAGRGFEDSDGDGICDNRGICGNQGNGKHQGYGKNRNCK